MAGSTRERGKSPHAKEEKEEEGELVGKEDEWATSYDDKLGVSRMFAPFARAPPEIIPSR